jgi:hypothetical protein
MPLSLSKLQQNSATAEFEYTGEKVHLEYRPSQFTPAKMAELGEQEKTITSGDLSALVEILTGLIDGWDVLDEPDGTPLPITSEILSELEFPFLLAAYQALVADAAMGKRNGMPQKKG